MPPRSLCARLVSAALCAALIGASWGPGAVYAAAAFRSAKLPSSVPTRLGGLKAAGAPAQGLGASGLQITNPLSEGVMAAPASVPAATFAAASPTQPAPAASAASLAPSSAQHPSAARQSLGRAAQRLDKAGSASAKAAALDALYSAAQTRGEGAEPVPSAPRAGSNSTGLSADNPARAGAQEPPKAPAAPPAALPDDYLDVKGLIGLFSSAAVSIVAYMLVSLSFVAVASPVVGWQSYATLMALGTLVPIASGSLNGAMIDRLSTRNVMTLNAFLRAALVLDLPLFAYFGVLNFWTLLLGALANGWMLSFIMTSQYAVLPRMVGRKYNGTINSALDLVYPFLQVSLGLVLQIGHVVDYWMAAGQPFNAFYIASLVQLFVAAPLCWFLLPASMPQSRRSISLGIGKYWKEAALFAAAAFSYLYFPSPMPMIAALLFWTMRTDSFRALWKGEYQTPLEGEKPLQKKRLFASMLYSCLAAFLMYPLQLFALPRVAETLAGAQDKSLLLGQFMGALFLGNLLATSTKVEIPVLRYGIQAATLALVAAWVYTSLFPGSWPAALAAAAAAAGLILIARSLTDRGRIQLFGVGFSTIWLPFIAWTVPAFAFLPVRMAMMLSLIGIGMCFGPTAAALRSYGQKNTRSEVQGAVGGIGSAFFNAALSLGYGTLGLASAQFTQAFPATLGLLGAAFLAGGILMALAPVVMPGLPETLFVRSKKQP